MKLTLLFCALLTGCARAQDWDWDVVTPLDEYIAAPDPSYEWAEIVHYPEMEEEGCLTWVVNFTSQTWFTPEVSNNPVWFHHLVISIPMDNFIHKDAGFMYIEGGKQTSSPPDPDDTFVQVTCGMAIDSGSVGALLRQIPNQPIRYPDDPQALNRTEDANIAWTWHKYFLDQSDPNILLQFPMTKAAVRAMDTVNAFVKEKDPTSDITRFMVAGGSKRGWITWLTGCVDRRVEVMAPIVLSVLNFHSTLHNHYESLGGWTYVFEDYYNVNLTKQLDDPITHEMMSLIDPFSFRRRMTMPKVVCSATGDEFFMPDDSHNFFHGLVEPKYMMMSENTNHGMVLNYLRLYSALGAVWVSHLLDSPRPTLSWTIETYETHGVITMTTDTIPVEVNVFYADTVDPVRRDFRLTTLDGLQNITWYNATELLEVISDYEYSVTMDISDTANYRGFLINAKYSSGAEFFDYDFTTEVNIIPAGKPFPPCVGEGCHGVLV